MNVETSQLQVSVETGAPIGFAEFVTLVAALMALGALGVDAMLPALPAIGASLDVAAPNSRQFVVSTFLLGFGIAQLAHGPLADRFGRRRMLLISLVCYVITNALAAVAGSFILLLAARFVGGAAISAARVATVAMVRDCYQGRGMARVMSIAFMAFMIVPVVAPSVGQLVLLIGSWRLIFWTIAAFAAGVFGWVYWRMPETMASDRALPLEFGRIIAGWRITLSDRLSLGYMLASTALMGGIYGYLNSIQQIMGTTFARPGLLALIFAVTASTMAVANLVNSRIVMRLGTRLISHGALSGLLGIALVHLVMVQTGFDTLPVFVAMMALMLACFGLAAANFSAMAMENMGDIAGTASSVQGFASVTGGSIVGALIGQAFDGTSQPMIAGFAIVAFVGLLIVFITERGRLFRRG